ncbi:hypothetical protein VDGD_04720 [Verticillium dahliae]|nr:hypothetical protein VdG1_03517 [Verticillium dahliae VDG1]RBQ70709.1 hypothetical protein VDGD_04720 [Verticillium dahliae]
MSEPHLVVRGDDSILSLAPLPAVLHRGLVAVSFFGFLSFISSVALLFFLLFKLVRWQLRPIDLASGTNPKATPVLDHELPDEHLCPQMEVPAPQEEVTTVWGRLRRDPPNQFLVLILNLLFADIQQALAFLLNAAWLRKDAIRAGTSMCWAQGWFVSTGDLASSVFIFLIAMHTYLGVVRGHRMAMWAFYTTIIGGWAFTYLTAIIGVIITNNGASVGGLYVRAGAWCWINSAYQDIRLFLHYLWIFLSLGITSAFYILIFFHIPKATLAASREEHQGHNKQNLAAPLHRRSLIDHASQRTFLLYPFIYVICTTPLAAGRVASMAGATPSLAYFCFSGSMIACNGWLDVLLYATTRRSIVFSDLPPSQDTGLETFAFMRTPPNRRFGNVVFVAGGAENMVNDDYRGHSRGGRKKLGSLGKLTRLRGEAGSSEDSLQGPGQQGSGGGSSGGGAGLAIQMETVTSVVVEMDHHGLESRSGTGTGRKGSLASDAVSIDSRV